MDSPRHNVVCGHGGFCQGRRELLWRFGLVFYRSAISGVILLAIAKVWKKTLRTGNFRTHFWRGITGFLSLTLFFSLCHV